jgi:hypothetical protein
LSFRLSEVKRRSSLFKKLVRPFFERSVVNRRDCAGIADNEQAIRADQRAQVISLSCTGPGLQGQLLPFQFVQCPLKQGACSHRERTYNLSIKSVSQLSRDWNIEECRSAFTARLANDDHTSLWILSRRDGKHSRLGTALAALT